MFLAAHKLHRSLHGFRQSKRRKSGLHGSRFTLPQVRSRLERQGSVQKISMQKLGSRNIPHVKKNGS
jgi:hypothetical protein